MQIDFPDRCVYSVHVENATVELLVEKSGAQNDSRLIGMTPHTHAYHELFACTAGEMTIDAERGEISLRAGDLAMIPANVRHVSRVAGALSAYRAVGVRFIRRPCREARDLFGRLNALCGIQARGLPSLCASVAELAEYDGADDCLPALRLTLLLCELADKTGGACAETAQALSDRDLRRASRLDYFINTCFMNPLTAEFVASQLFVSPRQLSRLVKKRYGVSLRQAVTKKRVSVAAEMLREGGLPIAEIALSVGFGSVHSFYRAFSEEYGLSPQEYRRREGRMA